MTSEHFSSKPLAIDLFCGLGGWTEGLLAEGYYVVGFDIEQHVYGEHHYPAQLVLQDVRTLDGRQFKEAALIVASPPCQEYSYMAMPWTKAKERARQYRSGELDVRDLTALFDAAVRIGREAGVPTVIENVRGAQPWVGRSRWNFGSYHLWGDVPALMPMTLGREVMKAGVTHRSDGSTNFHGQKNPGFRFDGSGKSFQSESVNRHALAIEPDRGVKGFTPKGQPLGKNELGRRYGSKSAKRKMASAMIAKIPLALSRHIARTYYPKSSQDCATD